MKKFFNTAGPCQSDIHYMVNPLTRLKGIYELIEGRSYFIIHAPRQTGKTTYLYALMDKLNSEGKYTTLQVNIQPAASGLDQHDAMRIAAGSVYQQARMFLPESERPDRVTDRTVEHGLKGYLEIWSIKNPKPIVLFIDEADSLMDDMFLILLRQLRAGFETRPTGFPQSLALVGLRDVRDYKIRTGTERDGPGGGSPFNIKTDSLFMTGFTFDEVETLLNEHTQYTGQVFDKEATDEIFRLTQGQPWLTNALANQIVARLLDNDHTKIITLKEVTQAREELIQRRDTHLDSLIDKLREPSVKAVAEAVIAGNVPDFDNLNDAIAYTRDLGLIAPNAPVRFANPIYREIVPRVLSFGFHEMLPQEMVEPQWYIKEGKLDIEALLKAFQRFYRRNSEAWLEKYSFKETGRQLLLMAFLQRIINAGGRVEREMAAGNGRCDLMIEYGEERHVIELKLYKDSYTREDGLEQIAGYLGRLDLDKGYLIIFETRKTILWEDRIYWESEKMKGKDIIVVGM